MRSIRTISVLASLLAAAVVPSASVAQFLGIDVGLNLNITVAPPELPVYEQPPIPAPGYIFTPGYWHYDPDGYYWVPGTWVQPPSVGLLWTPGHWGWRDGIYVWNEGYWGEHIGFYGGVYYGFGYSGVGFEGGYWNNGVLVYNRSVNNFGSVTITNVYNKTVIVAPGASRVSFNGGTGGTTAQPTPQERAAASEPHTAPTTAQTQHREMASANPALKASANGGHPAVAATSKPGEFTGKGVVAAREVKPAPGAKSAAPSAHPTAALDKKGPTPAGQEHKEEHKAGTPGGAAGGTQQHATANSGTLPKTSSAPTGAPAHPAGPAGQAAAAAHAAAAKPPAKPAAKPAHPEPKPPG
jgi:hypothetical protein